MKDILKNKQEVISNCLTILHVLIGLCAHRTCDNIEMHYNFCHKNYTPCHHMNIYTYTQRNNKALYIYKVFTNGALDDMQSSILI